MTLNIKERLILGSILPKEGTIASVRIVQNLRAALSFSEEEHAVMHIVQNGDQLTWDPNVPQDAEIEMGPTAQKLVQDTLKRLSTEAKLNEDFVSLWDKFCPEGEV